jgi:drug/metabolite transporter (DMT)-like permease
VQLVALVFASTSAVLWGTADFAGGKASQRANALAVAVLSQAAGLPVLAIIVVAVGGPLLSTTDLAWSAAAGVAGLTGLALFYRALAGGAMAVVAPITGVTAAALPLVTGLIVDVTPPPLALLGAALAVVAIALVSLGPSSGRGAVTAWTVVSAILSGALFGLFFVLVAQTSTASGMWPLVGTRLGSLTVGAALLVTTRTAPRLGRGPMRWVVAAGTLDVTANALFLAASQHGPLSLVAPVAALYPAATVLLALVVERERVRPIQLAGLGLAAAALVLTASGP